MQLKDAYTAWKKQPTRPNMMHALQASQPIIEMALRSYVGSKDPVAISHARILAMRAIKSYDPQRGTQLRTHMLTQLQPLRRLAAKRRFVSHIPEQAQYDMSGLREAEADLTDELGREPTEAELADKTGLSMKRLRYLRQMAVPTAESSFAEEALQTDAPNPMNDWQDYVYYDLSPTDKKIFEWRTGYNKKPTLGVSEIAKKLNMSAGRVTQRANNIAIRLEEGLSLGPKPGQEVPGQG
jgi:DNA-directed RNA polymerase specialized sigma subunit